MIKIDTAQLSAFKESVKRAHEGLKDKSPAMREIAVFLDRWVQKNFQSSGGNVGGWENFKYGGRLGSKKKGNAQSIDGHHYVNGSAKLEINTGALRISFLPFATSDNAGIGSNLPWAQWQSEGTKTLPSRRMVPVISEVAGDVHEIFSHWVMVNIGNLKS